jgi:Flp pilus assembly protein TadD
VAAIHAFGLKDWLFIVALLAAVILVYQPAWHGGFLWDDEVHLLNNPVLKPGGLLKAWVPGTYINYWPLTFTAYRLEFDVWGLDPLGFHIVNIVLHAISAILVWRILGHLKAPGAMFAAALFALHPVNVESVAWIAQLKNVLSLLLVLLSVLLYLRYEERGQRWCFLWSIGVFFLSALAKGMAVTLPVVLLACAWWQRGRIARRDLLHVVPYLLIGVLMAGVEVWSQHLVASGGAPVRSDGLLSRAAIAGCAVWFYLGKLLWPVNLIFVYPRWNIDERNLLSYVPGVLLVILLALGWWQRRGWGRPVVMLVVCYVALLLPVLGFVNIYFMEYSLVADHWQYAATIVPCAMFAAAAATLGRRWRWPRPAGYAACSVVLAILASLSWQQSHMYADAETLYRTTLAKNPDCWMFHSNLGIVLFESGRVDEAITQYQQASEIKPDYVEAHANLGFALAQRGRFDEAIAHCNEALRIDPNCTEAHNSLGIALAVCGRFDEAIVHFQKALELQPDFANARNNLDLAQSQRKRILKDLAARRESLRSRPEDVALLNDTAWLLATNPNASIRNGAEAVELAQRAAQLSEGREPAVLGTLAAAYAEAGRFSEAVETARKALKLATQQNNEPLAESIKAKIPLYEAGTPFREKQQPALPGSTSP